jgi:peptidoglycan/LPS O-acetylase OafA/YrhL
MMAAARSASSLRAQRQPKAEILGIQYLRGVAALLVVIYHISLHVSRMSAQTELIALQSGVDIFFVISGFVMIVSTDCGRAATPLAFMRRRIVRIVPLYWAVTLAMIGVLLIAPQLVKTTTMTWHYALASLAFLAHESPRFPGQYFPLVMPGWTLHLEMLFYLLFSLGLVRGGAGWRLVLRVAAPVIILSAVGVLVRPGGIAGFYTNPIMLEFAYGMGLGWLFLQQRTALPGALPSPLPGALAVPLMLVAAALLILPPVPDLGWRALRFGLPALVLVAISLSVSLPRWRVSQMLGDISYSLYLTHFFVLSALAQLWARLHLTSPLAVMALYPFGTLVCCGVGLTCWLLIEKPLTKHAQALAGLGGHRSPS